MNARSGPKSTGRRLFDEMRDLQRYGMRMRPAPGLRPSEFMMLHSLLCCMARQVTRAEPDSSRDAPLVELAREARGPGVTVGELSEFTRQTPSGASQTIRALEEKGMVIRESSPTDRRLVYIRPTEQGWEATKESEKSFFARLDALVEAMGETDANRLIELMEKLNGIIRERAAVLGEETGDEPPSPPFHGGLRRPSARR